ncbi:MAG: hypothetical protein KIS94_05245 [Chitinophagales bacterium]|nr:hypothetical protein [Chitinophagales bacterium]
MRFLCFLLFAFFAFTGCVNKQTDLGNTATKNETLIKGELAFLLNYNGKNPEDVGLLTNHIVERRLANIMKDSFEILPSKTVYSSPIVASQETGLVTAKYFFDKEHQSPSAVLVVVVKREIFRMYYYHADSLLLFTDHPSVEPVGF